VVAFYALVLVPSVYYAIRVDQDNSLDRLIVQSDPDYLASQEFAKVFGGGDYAVVLAESPDPFAPPALARFDELDRALAAVPHAENSSVLAVYRRAHAGFQPASDAEPFRKFATGTELFRRQGLVGDHFLAIPLVLDVHNPRQRQDALAAIQQAIAPIQKSPAPLSSLVEVGQPYVDAYLDADTRRTSTHSFPLFALFVVVLNVALYRSLRTLLAFLITLAVCAATSVGFIGLTGGVFSLVSSVVPMTILITATATLVYLHSRFVEHPPGVSVEDHQIFSLTNKFLACTASVFATAVGFAALGVSKIRPIREMGIWVAVGLVFTWIIVFTLFPALQRILRTPTEQQRKVAGQWFVRFTGWLPLFSYRWRWVLVPSSLLLSAAGAVALFGVPGRLAPMQLQTNAVEYINHSSELYKNTKRLEKAIAGLSMTEVWLHSKVVGSVSDADVVRGLDRFQTELEHDPQVGAVIGPTTILRLMRYVGGQGDQLPTDEAGLEQLTSLLESRLGEEPMLQRFVEKNKLSDTHFAVVTRTLDYEGYVALDAAIKRHWAAALVRDPALKVFEVKTVGLAPLQAKISYHLVPTLVESFGLTVVIIFGTFLLVFRNGAARLMAMIPSLFAILVMFGFMRVVGMSLNVATILIASTVLGTSENDQIHFFYHFLEKRKESTEVGLRHTLRVAGRAIFFATLINAGGFCAFAMADLPPVRQFGILSALAFLLSMVADFTALPAALWMVFRERPDSLKASQPARHASNGK
jgi:predicted RND superfamily exporter protein